MVVVVSVFATKSLAFLVVAEAVVVVVVSAHCVVVEGEETEVEGQHSALDQELFHSYVRRSWHLLRAQDDHPKTQVSRRPAVFFRVPKRRSQHLL